MRKTPNETLKAPERRCILSGNSAPQSKLLRLALGPDGQVAPDIRAKAPGRGAWVGVNRDAFVSAQSKGKLRGALARAFKTGELNISENLADDVERALRDTTLNRLGLEARAGFALTGGEKIETAARRGQVHLLLHAKDAGNDGNKKLDQALRVGTDQEGSGARGTILPVDRMALSMAMGRQNAVHVAIVDKKAAERVETSLARWLSFLGCDNDLSAGAATNDDAPDIEEVKD